MAAIIAELMILSVIAPQRVGQIVLKQRFPPRAVVQLTALVIVLSSMVILLGQIVNQPIPVSTGVLIGLQIVILVTTILATFLIGRMFGGTGSLADTALILCWMHLIVSAVQFFQITLPALFRLVYWLDAAVMVENLLTAFSLFLFFWLYVHFVTVLHSFKSALKVLGGVALTMITVAFGGVGLMLLFFS